MRNVVLDAECNSAARVQVDKTRVDNSQGRTLRSQGRPVGGRNCSELCPLLATEGIQGMTVLIRGLQGTSLEAMEGSLDM